MPAASPEALRALAVLARRDPAIVVLAGPRQLLPERIAREVEAAVCSGAVPRPLEGAVFVRLESAPPLQSLGHRSRGMLRDLAGGSGRSVAYVEDLLAVLEAPGGTDAIAGALGDGVCVVTAADEAELARLRSSAVHRWIEPVPLGAVSALHARAIVADALPALVSHHGVAIDDAAVDDAISAVVAGNLGRLPGAALELLEDACAAASGAGTANLGVIEIEAAAAARRAGTASTPAAPGELADLDAFTRRLRERVRGQEAALTAVARTIRRAATGVADPDRPLGSFLFLGPTGVGKTELARTLAEVVFGDAAALLRLDMGEYQEPHAVARLVGAPPGYVGYEQGGHLTEPLRRRPDSVLLLDEIEKAHPDVLNTLLAVLDEGRLTDGYGRFVDARSTVVIMTSNLGSRLILDPDLQPAEIESRVRASVVEHFPPEFLSRIDDIVVFRRLAPEALVAIVDIQLLRLERRLARRGLTLDVGSDVRTWLANQMTDATYGARPLRAAIRRCVEDVIAAAVAEGRVGDGQTVRLRVAGDSVALG